MDIAERHADSSPSPGWTVRGQDRVSGELRRAVITGPRHAYILSGPAHSGKLTCALEFGAALLCPNAGDEAVPCHDCAICRRIGRGVFPDLTVYDLDTQAAFDRSQGKNLTLNISTVRRITSDVSLRPSEAEWKVVIVNDVETMQETAQEAFLKTLEEPPSFVVIVLLTTDADLLLPTIRSRCVTLRMQTPPASIVEQTLKGKGIDAGQASHIALLSEGQIGWAVMAANDSSLLEERASLRSRARTWIGSDSYQRLVTATLLADGFAKDRESVFAELMAAQRVWRDILHVAEGVNADNAPNDLRMPNVDISSTMIASCLRSIDLCIASLEANVRPRLALQSMVSSWPAVSL